MVAARSGSPNNHGCHHFGSFTAVIRIAIDFSCSLTSRLASWTQWTSVSVTQESWTLYRSLAMLIVFMMALRVSKGWCFGNGVYLRRRVLLLAQIRPLVLQWEARCLEEVEACCADVDGEAMSILAALTGADAAEKIVQSWRTSPTAFAEASSARTRPAFYGITASMAFSADLPLEEMLELAYSAQYVLHLNDDRMWLQRLVQLLQYILLRRVSLMEETRLYAQLYRRVMFPQATQTDALQKRRGRNNSFLSWTKTSRFCAWRLHRRPTWLVPLAVAEFSSTLSFPYLCLPLSYFPIESVLPYIAAESWLNDRLLHTLLAEWKKRCKRTLCDWAASTCTSATADKNDRRGTAACKISYWFLYYTAPLLFTQVELHRRAARRFCINRLYALVYEDEDDHNDDRATVRHRRGSRGSLRLLLRCASDWASRKPQRNEMRVVGQQVAADAPTFTKMVDNSSSTVKVGLLVRRALLLRAVSQCIPITLQVCFPRLSLRHFSELVLTGYYLNTAVVVPSHDFTSSTAEAPSSSSTVDTLLRSLAAQMLWNIAAGIAEVLLQRFIGSMGGQLSDIIAADITAVLQQNLLHVDEAFFRRWLRGTSLENGGKPSSLPQELRTGSAGSYLERHPLSADDVLSAGRRSGEKVMAVHDAVVKRWLRCAVLGLRAAFTREWRPLLGAVVTAWVDVPKLTSAIAVGVGYSLPQDVSRLLARRDESLPTCSPEGLRLLLEILAEDAENLEESQCASQHLLFPWRKKRTPAVFSYLSHPYLTLVVCANVWGFDHLLGGTQRNWEALSRLVKGVRTLHSTIAVFPFTKKTSTCKCPTRALHAVAAMQDDARCIAYYSLYHLEQVCHTALAASTAMSVNATAKTLHPLLDTEETQLLLTPRAIGYLPEHVDYFDLFSLPYRFILRQLGLEMVFAYRTAMSMQQESRQTAEEWWTLTLFNSTFNPLISVLQEGVQLLASCGTVLLYCTGVDQTGRIYLRHATLTDVLQSSHIIEVYRELLRSGVALSRLEETLSPVQQLCEWLPQAIRSERSALQAATDGRVESDASSLHTSEHHRFGLTALQRRRRLWRRHLARHRPELFFDRDDRIVGGLHLREGVRWHHVFFAFPQLHGVACSNEISVRTLCAVRPTLTDVTFTSPPSGVTAVIGPSGAGKSSLNLLLRRLYDPLPVIQQRSQNSGTVEVCLDDVGLLDEAEGVLQEVLRLALIENALPPPPPASSSAHRAAFSFSNETSPNAHSSTYGLSIYPSYIALDEIPMCLFSAAYIRQWFAWLPQAPTILPQHSFWQNLSVLSPYVTQEDAQNALQLCGCRDFIEDRHRTMHDKSGPLSGGERQRLALARAVAGVCARRRVDILQGFCGVEDDNDREERNDVVGGLVLDEPTGHLDALNEFRVLSLLAELQGSRAKVLESSPSLSSVPSVAARLPRLLTWIISHRMSSLRSATFMVVVEDGAVTATGSPHDVLEGNAFAQKQWQYQRLRGLSGGEELGGADDGDADEEKRHVYV